MRLKLTKIISLLWLVFFSQTPALASNSNPELQAVLRDLMTWWPGEYDTLAQVKIEQQQGAPPDGPHDRQYRVFARVNVPHIGENVIYGEVHSVNKDGPLIKGQQVLYIVSIDNEQQAVVVRGRRIKDGALHEQAHLYPEKLHTLELDSAYGGNCDFRFRRYGRDLRGWLANAGQAGTVCTMQSKVTGQTMTWDADWAITPSEIWVFDNGYLQNPAQPEKLGRLFAGREDRVAERLYKGRPFTCSIRGITDGKELKNSAVRTVVLHDRGGELDLGDFGSAGHKLRLLRLAQPAPAPEYWADVLTLSVVADAQDKTMMESRATPWARTVKLNTDTVQARCKI